MMQIRGGLAMAWALVGLLNVSLDSHAAGLPEDAETFFEEHCFDCHDSEARKGDLDLEGLGFGLTDAEVLARWVLIYDRVRGGEMPPDKRRRPERQELDEFLGAISGPMVEADRGKIATSGRSVLRRLNRLEYENTLRHVLDAPWLLVADRLPEDGVDHLFNKIGARLDVSHVQLKKYLETADYALREAVAAAAYPTSTAKYYARQEPNMVGNFKYRWGQTAATRASIPLLGTRAQPEVILGDAPVSVGESDPETRELEAVGYVCGTYTATTKYDFTRMRVASSGRYRIRMKSYTFMAGPNGRSGGKDHGLRTGSQAWWRPDRNVALPGQRSEPITLYALSRSGDSRWLATYDANPDPRVIEREVSLREGEGIRPDAGRLVRTRPGWDGNANATREGIPGFALNWLEVEGPVNDTWPPESYQAVFGDLDFEVVDGRLVRALSEQPAEDARRLLARFLERTSRQPIEADQQVEPFLAIYERASELGEDFTDAVIAACASILCSSEFLYLESRSQVLDDSALASRLSYFLWNGPPDDQLSRTVKLGQRPTLRRQAERMLGDPRSDRFIDAFLDYWLDLREINSNTPDAILYPDYYLDDQLTEASLIETRSFVRDLIANDLPARNLVDADFAYANERLAIHYGLEPFEGVQLRRVELPPGSPRGGLMTQSSVMRVTANGTTTSPVVRGAWMMERLLGVEIPPPPSGIEAIEPDTRGATTLREQLSLHRQSESCNACHAKFDPAGFALESFDVTGGWRDRYRAIGDIGEPAVGIGKNGHRFTFRNAKVVDCSGELGDGRAFADIVEFKKLLLEDERQIARNLVNQLVTYATGAPVSFSDRAQVEEILDQCAAGGYGVRSLIHAIIDSSLFRRK
ncbi:MAG: DUF1592 domain-containing protein [Verrucomicrobiales bacterium]